MNLCSNYCDRVGKDKAYDDFFAVFNSAKTRLSIIWFIKHIHLF